MSLFATNAEADRMEIGQQAGEGGPVCGLCESAPAAFTCDQCDGLNLCAANGCASDLHRAPRLASHQPRAIGGEEGEGGGEAPPATSPVSSSSSSSSSLLAAPPARAGTASLFLDDLHSEVQAALGSFRAPGGGGRRASTGQRRSATPEHGGRRSSMPDHVLVSGFARDTKVSSAPTSPQKTDAGGVAPLQRGNSARATGVPRPSSSGSSRAPRSPLLIGSPGPQGRRPRSGPTTRPPLLHANTVHPMLSARSGRGSLFGSSSRGLRASSRGSRRSDGGGGGGGSSSSDSEEYSSLDSDDSGDDSADELAGLSGPVSRVASGRSTPLRVAGGSGRLQDGVSGAATPVTPTGPSGWSQVCNHCHTQAAELYCFDCDMYLCGGDGGGCSRTVHRPRRMQFHRPCKLPERPGTAGAAPAQACQLCDSAPAEVHCGDCGLRLCLRNGCNADVHTPARMAGHRPVALATGRAAPPLNRASTEPRLRQQAAGHASGDGPPDSCDAEAAHTPNREASAVCLKCELCDEGDATVLCLPCNLRLCVANRCVFDVHRAARVHDHELRLIDGAKATTVDELLALEKKEVVAAAGGEHGSKERKEREDNGGAAESKDKQPSFEQLVALATAAALQASAPDTGLRPDSPEHVAKVAAAVAAGVRAAREQTPAVREEPAPPPVTKPRPAPRKKGRHRESGIERVRRRKSEAREAREAREAGRQTAAEQKRERERRAEAKRQRQDARREKARAEAEEQMRAQLARAELKRKAMDERQRLLRLRKVKEEELREARRRKKLAAAKRKEERRRLLLVEKHDLDYMRDAVAEAAAPGRRATAPLPARPRRAGSPTAGGTQGRPPPVAATKRLPRYMLPRSSSSRARSSPSPSASGSHSRLPRSVSSESNRSARSSATAAERHERARQRRLERAVAEERHVIEAERAIARGERPPPPPFRRGS